MACCEHRAAVLESIATSPSPATNASIRADCVEEGFSAKNVLTMVSQLQREGLIGRIDQGYFITRAGFDYLTGGRFDRKLPEAHERPKSRRIRKEKA